MAMNTRAQAPRVPDRAAPEGLEAKWGEAWESQGTYAFDRTATREQVYSIDTPPPTVSGSLHIGHVFSYTHTDVVARYQRMIGKSVFYPMGWDDNGLPTERRVQNYFGVRVDATLPYDPDFEPPHVGGDGKSIKARDQKPISRKNFVELCERLTVEDEAQFEALWRYLGLSVDWKQNYQTIGARARKVAQAAFLRNLARGEAYQAEAPGLWDVTFQTAVAQAELESREYPGFYHRLAFHITDAEAAAKAAAAGAPVEDGVDVCIETTRPELLAACVALALLARRLQVPLAVVLVIGGMALALVPGESRLTVLGQLESAPYVTMTQQVMALFGKNTAGLAVSGGRFHSPGKQWVEGDWSNAAFFLAAKALGSDVQVENLNLESAQGDRACFTLLPELTNGTQTICAADIPDLVPILSVVAAAAHGAEFTNIHRLRLKESDRVEAVIHMLTALGGQAEAMGDTLRVYGTGLTGGTVDSRNDHRIAMSAAIASTVCSRSVTILGAECIEKSYPSFFREFKKLGGSYEQHLR